MNIFVLDRMPEKAAEYSFDCHIRSGLIETVYMMGGAYNKGEFSPWPWVSESKMLNHKMTRWVRENRNNFSWCLQHAEFLGKEFEYRFGKKHKCLEYIEWISHNLPIYNLQDEKMTDFPKCFGDYKDDINESLDTVSAYRMYYKIAKKHLEKYTKRNLPYWYN